jgi:MHS family shikimate/dehydroshikimate transporter-like MFS transporter
MSRGLSPLIAAWLMAWTGGATWPDSLYLVTCACVTLIAVACASEPSRQMLV